MSLQAASAAFPALRVLGPAVYGGQAKRRNVFNCFSKRLSPIHGASRWNGLSQIDGRAKGLKPHDSEKTHEWVLTGEEEKRNWLRGWPRLLAIEVPQAQEALAGRCRRHSRFTPVVYAPPLTDHLGRVAAASENATSWLRQRLRSNLRHPNSNPGTRGKTRMPPALTATRG